jgi:phosphate starvation-inducible PhoH-like protein
MPDSVFETDDSSLYKKLCGSNDKNVRLIEQLTGSSLIPRGNTLIVNGDNSASELTLKLLHLLCDLITKRDDRYEPDEFEIRYTATALQRGLKITADDILRLKVIIPDSGKIIMPKTMNQADYLHSIFTRPLTFGVGPAGTGKTFLAVVAGLYLLLTGKTERIILSRPAVEAGENLGFLPGDLIQKINPYLRPLYDALFELQPAEKISRFIEKGIIEIAPLAYMRGRTLNNSFIILDEAQNTLKSQMKMFLTRLGNNSKFVISGDETQIDIDKPKDSGLFHAMKILKNINDIRFIKFTRSDISRHPLVEKIVEAYENERSD